MINDLTAGLFSIHKATQNNVIISCILTMVRDCNLSMCEESGDKYSYNVISEGEDFIGFSIDKIEGDPWGFKYVIEIYPQNEHRLCRLYKKMGVDKIFYKEMSVDEDLWLTSTSIAKEIFGYNP
ncbi:MAG: hypothetical protein MJZ34_07415 [Paludibacteraceae bacterium]|nr:hypothetical protein [Paludibacteraceae bacterium]